MAQAFTQIQTTVGGAQPGTSFTLAYSSNNTLGNLLVVFLQVSALISTVTDSQGNTWVQGAFTPFGTNWAYAYYVKNCKAGANTITVVTSGSSFTEGFALEYSGLDPSSPLIGSNTGAGTGTAVLTSNVTSSAANNAVLGFACSTTNGHTFTEGAGFTRRAFSASGNQDAADNLNQPPGTFAFSGTYDSSNTWGALVLVFQSTPVLVPGSPGSQPVVVFM